MQKDRWLDVVAEIKKNFQVEDSGTINDDEQGGTVTEFIVFESPMGIIRLEFSTHPLILETKTKYHKRIGSETEIEYVFSPTEKSSKLEVFRWDEALDDWQAFKTQAFS
jgi:hypothetical protein